MLLKVNEKFQVTSGLFIAFSQLTLITILLLPLI